MRKTKIICTIGPASENEEVLTQMCLAGMNVARLNFSHGSYEEHERKIALIKQVRQKLGLPIAIMLDTKGPEYRIKTFAQGKVLLREGDRFSFTTEQIVGDDGTPARWLCADPGSGAEALTACSLSIPVMDGALALGTWQGIYLWEHRHYRGRRRVVMHLA